MAIYNLCVIWYNWLAFNVDFFHYFLLTGTYRVILLCYKSWQNCQNKNMVMGLPCWTCEIDFWTQMTKQHVLLLTELTMTRESSFACSLIFSPDFVAVKWAYHFSFRISNWISTQKKKRRKKKEKELHSRIRLTN